MASLDMASFQAALKQHYTKDRIENMTYQDNPLLAMLPKYKQFGGDVLKLPIIHGDPQGRGVTISQAQSTKTPSQLKAFLLTRVSDYAVASIQNEVLEASKGDANAFMTAATTEIDGAMHNLVRTLAIDAYRTGSGSRGQCNAAATGTSLVLKNPDDVTNFEVNQELVFSTADGGGTVKSGSVTVVGVDRDSGTLTVDALTAIASGAGVAANDYIFIQGDYDQKIKGISAWVPATAPTSTPFFGVDRSADVTRLGGIRFDASAMPIEEGLIAAASRAAREGAKPTHCFMNYSDYVDLEKALGSKVQYVNITVKPEVGFRGVLINGPRGPINVIPDQNCPSGRAFMLQLDTWKLYSLGECPRILDSDGLKMLREAADDAVELRIGFYAQIGCRAPGWNVNIKLR